MTQSRFTTQVHKCHPTQPTPEAVNQGLEAHLCFLSFADPNSHIHLVLTLWPPAGPRELCPSTPGRRRPHAHACKLPATPGLSLSEVLHIDQREISTYSLGKFPWDGSLQLQHVHSNIFEHLWQCQSFTGNLQYVEQKWFRTPWEALKQYDILSNLIQFHIFCQCFPNFVVLQIWQLFLVYPYKTGSAFKEKCAQVKSVSSLPAIMGTFFPSSLPFCKGLLPPMQNSPSRTFSPSPWSPPEGLTS